jgi:hypothetical protein
MHMTQMRRHWTDEEIVKLMNMAQKYPPAQIASEIGRALPSVHTKARQLDISLRMDRRHPQTIDPGDDSGLD